MFLFRSIHSKLNENSFRNEHPELYYVLVLQVSYLARQTFRGTVYRSYKRQPNVQGKAPKATQTGMQPSLQTCWHQRHQRHINLPLDMRAETGHQVPNTSVVSEEAQDPEILAFQEHQASAARLSHAEEARTLMAVGKCVLPV